MYPRSATDDGHSSNAIAIVEASLDWMRMLLSGDIKMRAPSICEAKATPSSVMLRSCASEKT